MRQRGVPVTWALDPALNGTSVGGRFEVVTDAQLATYYAAGDDINIHSWDGAVTADKTPAQIRDDSLLALKWLQDRGYTRGREERSAWTQNQATNGAAAQPYFAAYATTTNVTSIESWPFLNKYNVGRIALHGRTTSYIDTQFSNLQATRSLLVCYTHGIHADGTTNGGADITPTEWAYFLSKIDAGLSGGWLEGVTFSQLLERSGGVVR